MHGWRWRAERVTATGLQVGNIGVMPRIRYWPLTATVLLAAALVLGVVSTRTTLLTDADERISERLYGTDTGLAAVATTAFDVMFSPVVGGLIALALVVALSGTGRIPQATLTAAVIGAGWLSAAVVKKVLDRPRPEFAVQDSASFPSGHTALATSLLFATCLLVRGASRDIQDTVIICGVLLLVGLAFARVALGAHYLTDTVGAMLWSSGVCLAVIGLWPHLQRFLPPVARWRTEPDPSPQQPARLPG